MPKKTFEQAIKRLEEIVAELEEGNLPLEESLKIYEEGVELTKFCSTKLNETEDKIKTLVKTGADFKLKSTDI
ncbi:exodeoxyribonuclease VII small subunit [candidate division KSB1 bacterium]|nr:exodeoxyribonuclease VII small subunit [candidate division KSB1 bacterium]MCH7674261.1 exodeoxyribonuclease VII small subunit [candidate division KSB1 bacterium]MCH7753713.1 exodeoxyribonuclease VII small subunit [candidate division KSB1 bacterium]MCH8018702.1 exodeoxyribonuclease VII small subunit [candidate division KSB1 bacterium]MCH8874633.1 exodeoxyribonuclease VII small subunit [candidate division KSB1 bacterium]